MSSENVSPTPPENGEKDVLLSIEEALEDEGMRGDDSKAPESPECLMPREVAAEEVVLEIRKETPDEENSAMKDDVSMEECTSLTEDIYSLFFTAKASSAAFIFALFVFCFQTMIAMLILFDLLDDDRPSNNPLKVPAGVNLEVTIAQGLALPLAVATQGDVITALIWFHDGYDKRVKEENSSLTFSKWLLAGFGQFIAGGTLLVDIFILVVQSTKVVSLFLNFAALSFVSEIDNIAFELAKRGFVSESVDRDCNLVTDFTFPARPKKPKHFRRIIFLLVTAGLMAGYGYVVHLQRSGRFVPFVIFVQFGDAFEPALATFSGVYDQGEKYIGRRAVYIDRRSKHAMFAYCQEEGSWTFSINETDPCEDWVATSPETNSYDITSSSSGWIVRFLDEQGDVFEDPFQSFILVEVSCKDNGDCSNKGQCRNGECQCDDGRIGLICEFGEPCLTITVDERTSYFPDDEALVLSTVSNKFVLLKDEENIPVQVYDKPVYIFDHGQGVIDILLFLGRRWSVTNTLTFVDDTRPVVTSEAFNFAFDDAASITNTSELANFLSNQFHGFFSNYFSYFVSAPVVVGTPSYQSIPVGLQWFRVKQTNKVSFYSNAVDRTQPLSTRVLCGVCITDVNDCLNFGECNDGECSCLDGFYGPVCEKSLGCIGFGCYSNGTCDEVTGNCNCTEGYYGHLCEINGTTIST